MLQTFRRRDRGSVTSQIGNSPKIENASEMHNIHCAISVFMVEVQTALAGAMNAVKALAGAMHI